MEKIPSVRGFLLEFISLYRSLPALWKQKSREYSDRKLKAEAYEVLVAKYRQVEPGADRERVKKKINSLRSNYRKELRKIRRLQRQELEDAPPVYEPALWYFDELGFLGQHETTPDGIITVPDELEPASASVSTPPANDEVYEEPPKPIPTQKMAKKRTREGNQQNELLFISCDDDSEYEMYAKAWAMELKKMKPEQQLYAKKAINEILLEGQLETLHRDSVHINLRPAGSSPAGFYKLIES